MSTPKWRHWLSVHTVYSFNDTPLTFKSRIFNFELMINDVNLINER